MSLSPAKMDLLRQLSLKHLTTIDLVTPQKIRMVQDLVNAGYARDFAAHKGHNIRIGLRIWGITPSGKAVLEQREMITTTTRQPALPIFQKEVLQWPTKGRLPRTHPLKFKDRPAVTEKMRNTPTSIELKKTEDEHD